MRTSLTNEIERIYRLSDLLRVNRSKVMMELSQRRAYKLARDDWIESGMVSERPGLEAAELRASEAEKRAQDLESELSC